MTLETHASLDRHLSIKDIARGIANDWNPSEEACLEAERIWANVERLRGAVVSTTQSKTICGRCGHAMHWMGCFASLPSDAGPDGECSCRNDVSTLATAQWRDESGDTFFTVPR